ncbi:MAG: hypothetical protein HYY01_06675 [Chloroflexi bacterium]|nr:hypothetical protein [Chloroflexota bacterium]
MHEPFLPDCGHCTWFLKPFDSQSPLGDWGFCSARAGGALPERDVLHRLEVAARGGDFAPVLSFPGLFPEGDDGCEAFCPL